MLVAALLCLLAAHASAEPIALKCGRLFDGRALRLQQNAVVVIDDKKIRAAGPSVAIPAGAEVIDLSHMTVLPGLVDAHTHMFLHGLPY